MDLVEMKKMSPMMQQKNRLGEAHPTLALLKVLDKVEELEKQIGKITEIILQAGHEKISAETKAEKKKAKKV